MKYLLSIFFLSFFINHLSAQEKHFVFIQSETKQPFYVSVNGKLYSSTASGYVIIPKLSDGNYNFTVGFAQNAFPEQTFSLGIQSKDLGFDLKNFNEKGWGLFNLETLDITMTSTSGSSVVSSALNANNSSKTLAPVITFDKKKDTIDHSTPVLIATDKFEGVSGAISKSDSSKENVNTSFAPSVASTTQPSENVINKGVETKSNIKKISEVIGDNGVKLSYSEGTGKTKDTIDVIIPSSTLPPAYNQPSDNASRPKNLDEKGRQSIPLSNEANQKSDVKFLDVDMSAKKDSLLDAGGPKGNTRIFENSNCKNIATDEDYTRLRKKMASETTDEKMISEAKKFYRNKCFTTNQIKQLSTLFPSDEGRFKFFDASFVSVADASQYYKLQSEFIDPAYINRFKTLLQ